jgi:hypothetical protein
MPKVDGYASAPAEVITSPPPTPGITYEGTHNSGGFLVGDTNGPTSPDTRPQRPVNQNRGEWIDRFKSNHPQATNESDRFAEIALVNKAFTIGAEEELTSIRDKLAQANLERGHRDSMYRRAGELPDADAYKGFDRIIANLKTRQAQLRNNVAELPRSQMDKIEAFMSANHKFVFRELDPAEFDNGKSLEQCWDTLKILGAERKEIGGHNITSDEAEARVRAYVQQRADAGEVIFGQLLSGEGGLILPELNYPQLMEYGEAGRNVLGEDVLGLSLWLNGHEDFADKLVARMREMNSGVPQISNADRAAQYAANEAAFVMAYRNLEFAIRKDELNGKRKHKRPSGLGAEYLLWLDLSNRKPAPDPDFG